MRKYFFLFLLTAFSLNAFAVSTTRLVHQSEFSATTSSSKALEENLVRNYLLVVNKCAATAYLKFDGISSGTEGVPILAGGNYEPFIAPTGSVYLKASTGTCTILLIEGIRE